VSGAHSQFFGVNIFGVASLTNCGISLANYDDVLLDDSVLIVRKERFGKMVEHRFNRGFCRVSLSRERHPIIRIEESVRLVEFGQWIRPTEVNAIFTELQAKISQQRAY
jgi:uncharacterized membrane protein